MSVSAYFTLLTLILGLWWGRLYKGDRWGMDDGWGICQQHIHPVSNSNGIQMQIWEGCWGFEYIDCITLCWIHVPFGIYFVCLSIYLSKIDVFWTLRPSILERKFWAQFEPRRHIETAQTALREPRAAHPVAPVRRDVLGQVGDHPFDRRFFRNPWDGKLMHHLWNNYIQLLLYPPNECIDSWRVMPSSSLILISPWVSSSDVIDEVALEPIRTTPDLVSQPPVSTVIRFFCPVIYHINREFMEIIENPSSFSCLNPNLEHFGTWFP